MQETVLPLGKLPPDFTATLLKHAPILDTRVLLGPGVGLDCAVIDMGETCLVMKSDPITFVTEDIGWYAVQICSNDIATTGATPRWFLTTLLLPEGKTTPDMVTRINEQVFQACRDKGISVVGGHTEITYGLERPILMGTMIGEVRKADLITPQGARPGDSLLLTKSIPLEGAAIAAKEFPHHLAGMLDQQDIQRAADFIRTPGISVLRDAQLAVQAGRVTAMHDPTEGGLAAALWELAEASGHDLVINKNAIPIDALSEQICRAFDLNPLSTIASGALLLAVKTQDAQTICNHLSQAGIPCTVIGQVEAGQKRAWLKTDGKREVLLRPERDDITRLYEQSA